MIEMLRSAKGAAHNTNPTQEQIAPHSVLRAYVKRRVRTAALTAATLLAIAHLTTGQLNAQTGNLRAVYNRMASADLRVPASAASTRALLANGNEKIDPGLRLLMAEGQRRGFGNLEDTARSLGVAMSDDRVAVSLLAEDGADPEAVRRRVEAAGGEVSGIVGNAVLAEIPLRSIDGLGNDRDVYYVARQETLYADYQATSPGDSAAGVMFTKADQLHRRGIKGRGVKIGILDFGFGRYHELEQRGLVPTPKVAKQFGKTADWAVGTVHGAACAEIIHAMAPDAELYIAMVGDGNGGASSGEINAAAEFLESQKVDIISFSGGGHGGPHDGRDIMDKMVEKAAAQGILWVNAAGNEGASHWAGPAQDKNNDGWIDIGPKGEPGLAVQAPNCGQPQCQVSLLITWNDWGPNPLTPSATEDIDAFLFTYDASTGNATQVAQSVNPQQGRGAPQEFVSYNGPPGQIYLLALRPTHVTKPVRVHVFSVSPSQMFPVVPGGSIGIPGTSASALTVAAIDVTNSKLETYSSQGPTDDDRVKPDISAPDNDISAAYTKDQAGRFRGTSAACPHASGMAALIKQMNPSANLPGFRQSMIATARMLGATVPNNETGFGLIDAELARAGGSGGGTGTSPTTTLVIPGALGGKISSAALDRMRASAADDDVIHPKVVVGRPSYKPGDGLKIGFRVDEDCYYLLVHRDSGGHYTLLAPTASGAQKLHGGEKYAEPSGENRTLRITPPAGTEEVLLICSTSEADLNSWRPGARGVAVAVVRYQVEE